MDAPARTYAPAAYAAAPALAPYAPTLYGTAEPAGW
jgi:hypothetical protein